MSVIAQRVNAVYLHMKLLFSPNLSKEKRNTISLFIIPTSSKLSDANKRYSETVSYVEFVAWMP